MNCERYYSELTRAQQVNLSKITLPRSTQIPCHCCKYRTWQEDERRTLLQIKKPNWNFSDLPTGLCQIRYTLVDIIEHARCTKKIPQYAVIENDSREIGYTNLHVGGNYDECRLGIELTEIGYVNSVGVGCYPKWSGNIASATVLVTGECDNSRQIKTW